MNPPSSLGGLIQSSSGTAAGPAGITPANLTGGVGTTDLSGLIGDLSTTPLLGGSATSEASGGFDPALFEPGGIFSPTGGAGGAPATPAAQQAQQDPSGQVPPDQQTVDRSGRGDLAQPPQQPDQTVDRSGRADRATTSDGQPAGPTGTPGQQQPGQGQDQTRLSGLAQLAKAMTAKPTQQPAPASAATPQPATPQPAATAQPATPTPAAPRSAGGAPAGAAPQPQVPGTQPGAGTGQQQMPDLLQRILSALLGVPVGGGQQPLQGVAQQAYPQRPVGPMTPTGGLGPFGRALAARRRAFQRDGQGGDQGGDQGDRDFSGARISPPGSTSEVSAPTADQLRATRMAGSDTPPTEGFSNVLKSERSRYGNELKDDKTKWETLGVIALEMEEDPAAVAESLLNRSNYTGTSLHNMIHSGFYGPVNHGALAREIRALQRNPERAAKINAGLETALRGSNLLGGATDQGSSNDPNANHRGGRVTRFKEIYNDWGGGPGGHDGAALWRRQQQQRVRQEQQQGKRGEQLAMDIGRRSPTVGGPEIEGGGMVRRGAPATEFENITEQRRKREREQQRKEAVAS